MTTLEEENFDHVVLVDPDDSPVGTLEKHLAHADGGILHRAFSVFILNDRGELLLQRRANAKYHCAGLWSNSCCSHPREGKDVADDARTRLQVELGFSTDLEFIGHCTYKVAVNPGLTEWELDHLYVGNYFGEMRLNPAEVDSIRWCRIDTLQNELLDQPDQFTPWLPHILPAFADWIRRHDCPVG